MNVVHSKYESKTSEDTTIINRKVKFLHLLARILSLVDQKQLEEYLPSIYSRLMNEEFYIDDLELTNIDLMTSQ